jgi:hypothetical protein
MAWISRIKKAEIIVLFFIRGIREIRDSLRCSLKFFARRADLKALLHE